MVNLRIGNNAKHRVIAYNIDFVIFTSSISFSDFKLLTTKCYNIYINFYIHYSTRNNLSIWFSTMNAKQHLHCLIAIVLFYSEILTVKLSKRDRAIREQRARRGDSRRSPFLSSFFLRHSYGDISMRRTIRPHLALIPRLIAA